MHYNIVYKTFRDFGASFILLLDEKQIEKFSVDFKNGERTFFHGGTSFSIYGTNKILIYDTSKVPNIDKENIRKFIEALNARQQYLNIELTTTALNEYGIDVTSRFIADSWGKGNHGNQQAPSIIQVQYVSSSRIDELIAIKSDRYDLTKLIHLVKELNSSSQYANWYAVGALIRTILDHVPPIFGCENFKQVANNYSSPGRAKSFRESMEHLNLSMRKIADSFLHSHITKSETLPNEQQVDCKRDLDRLLEEIVRILKS